MYVNLPLENIEEIGEAMNERVRYYRDLLAKTPVDEIQVQEKPVVLFRVSDNTWLEAIVRYLVDPKQRPEELDEAMIVAQHTLRRSLQ